MTAAKKPPATCRVIVGYQIERIRFKDEATSEADCGPPIRCGKPAVGKSQNIPMCARHMKLMKAPTGILEPA